MQLIFVFSLEKSDTCVRIVSQPKLVYHENYVFVPPKMLIYTGSSFLARQESSVHLHLSIGCGGDVVAVVVGGSIVAGNM